MWHESFRLHIKFFGSLLPLMRITLIIYPCCFLCWLWPHLSTPHTPTPPPPPPHPNPPPPPYSAPLSAHSVRRCNTLNCMNCRLPILGKFLSVFPRCWSRLQCYQDFHGKYINHGHVVNIQYFTKPGDPYLVSSGWRNGMHCFLFLRLALSCVTTPIFGFVCYNTAVIRVHILK